MLNQLLATYEEFGYKFLVFISNGQEEAERRYIHELMAYKIEGLTVLSHTIPSRELAELSIPLVTIEREDQYAREAVIPISTVGQQTDKIAYKAVSLLVEQMNERKKRRPVPLAEPIHLPGRSY